MLTAISVFCAAEPDLSCPAGGGHIALHLQVMTTCPVIFGAIFCSTVRGARRTSIIHRQGYAAGKHYSSSGVRGGQALFIAREEFFFQKLCHVKCRHCRLAAEIYPLVYSGFTSEMDLKLVRTSQQRYQNGLIKTE